MPDLPRGIDVSCGECGAHYQLDPSGDIAGAACSECGGTRFFRSQPSPTQSDGTLRNMVDSDTQIDQGGNPLGEGTIMGTDGERPMGKRDNYMHSKVAALFPPCPNCGKVNGFRPYPFARGFMWCMNDRGQGCQHLIKPKDLADIYNTQTLDLMAQPEIEHPLGPHTGNIATSIYEQIAVMRRGLPENVQHEIDNKLLYEGPNSVIRFLQSQNSTPTTDYVTPTWEMIRPVGRVTSATERVEPMRTFNMEPYAPLWDESYLPAKTAGPLAEMAAPLVGGAVRKFLPYALPFLMKGALGQGGGEQAGGMAPETPDPAPGLAQLSSVDIPFVLLADYDTPHSVRSVGEQHDDPENQDQKEFNDEDNSPKNLKNPNNDDSGADGEDGVRDATDGYGIGENSPSVERAMMILPLLLHYFHSGESGQSDPLIRALHDSLEKESPGYLENGHPDGQKYVELIIQQHGQHAPHHAGVNAFVGELPAMPTPGAGMQAAGGGTCPSCGGVLAGDGSCPQCGSKQHPQGGMDTQMPTAGGAASVGGPSYPPNRVGTSGPGPQTPEQKAAVIQLLEQQGRHGEIPMVELEPWRFAKELAEIQGQPNVAPLVDPSQAQPTPAPMPPMMNAPGAMPVPDPTQAGGGMGMPMQPMAHIAGPNLGRPTGIPPQGGDPTTWWNAEFDPQAPTWHKTPFDTAACPACGEPTGMNMRGHCRACGYIIGDEDGFSQGGMGLNTYNPGGKFVDPPGYTHPGDNYGPSDPHHFGKTADANNNVPRCPKCGTATTSVTDGLDGEGNHKGRCHSCGYVFGLHEGRVVLTDLMNPALEGAGEQKAPEVQHNEHSTLRWQDSAGQPLQEGGRYSLYTPGYQAPEEVEVVRVKPNEVELKLAGDVAGLSVDMAPDFKISASEMDMRGYKFEPSNDAASTDEAQPTPLGGMPGLEQIPQTPETTDELSSSYPNKGTMASIVASDEVEDSDELCHKCGCDWITHTASSETTTMHECARCGAAWETRDEYIDHHARVDLDWLNDDPRGDSFHAEMARAQQMREYSQQSRNLSVVAAKDPRLQATRDLLERNRSNRERTAGRHFTPSEQRALVNEKGTARNLEDLDLEGTHYVTRYDPTGKANGLNAPDSHLILGL